MDTTFVVVGVVIAVLGLFGLAVAVFHPHPGNTRIIRALAWPGIRPTDRVALPLSGTLASTGLLLGLTAWHGAPVFMLLAIAVIGFASAIMLGLRRSEA